MIARATRSRRRQDGSIRKLQSGSYNVRLFAGRDAEGKRIEFTGTAVSLQDARALLQDFRRRKATGVTPRATSTTLGNWIDQYFRTADHLRPRTRDSYAYLMTTYLPDHLRVVQLDRLTSGAIKEWLIGLQGRSSTRGGTLGQRTIRYCRMVLHLVLNKAVEDGMLAVNPVARVRLASASTRREVAGSESTKEERARVSWFSEDEVQRFLAAADARTARMDASKHPQHRDRFAAFWRLALETALRPSELLGLRWQDVTLDASGSVKPHLHVHHSLTSAKGDGVLDPPKTRKSIRTVPLSETAVRALRAHRAVQAADKLAAGGGYRDLGFVFATTLGTPVYIDNFRSQVFVPLLRAAKIEGRRIYDLRHTAISLMLRAGVPVHVVAARAGHTSAR